MFKQKGKLGINIFICPNTIESHLVILLQVQTQWKVTYYYFYMSKHKGKSRINIFICPKTMESHVRIFLYAPKQWKVTY